MVYVCTALLLACLGLIELGMHAQLYVQLNGHTQVCVQQVSS